MLAALISIFAALALGAFASLSLIWQWAAGGPARVSLLYLLAVISVTTIILIRRLNRTSAAQAVKLSPYWWLLLAVCSFFVFWMIEHGKSLPDGGWDGWAIWNLHARFLYRGSEGAWKGLFDHTLFWSHNDYPLLLPALVRDGWTLAGSEQQAVPMALGAAFPLLVAGVLFTATSVISGAQRGFLAGVTLLATPGFFLLAGAQMADVPLSLYILTTVVLLKLSDDLPSIRNPLLILAGFSAGLTAWMKNEGLVFVLVVFLVRGLHTVRQNGFAEYRREAARIAAGMAPVLALVGAYRIFLAPPVAGDLQFNIEALQRVFIPHRYVQIARSFARDFSEFGGAAGGVNPAVLAGLALLYFGSHLKRIGYTALMPVLMLCSYGLVYLVTPLDLQAHLDTSSNRLLMQLWPASIFVLFTIPASPAGLWNRQEPRESEFVSAVPVAK